MIEQLRGLVDRATINIAEKNQKSFSFSFYNKTKDRNVIVILANEYGTILCSCSDL